MLVTFAEEVENDYLKMGQDDEFARGTQPSIGQFWSWLELITKLSLLFFLTTASLFE
jgi:hypothetical protein